MKVKIKNAKIAVDRMDRAREDNNQRYLDRMKFGIETHISLEEQKKAIQIQRIEDEARISQSRERRQREKREGYRAFKEQRKLNLQERAQRAMEESMEKQNNPGQQKLKQKRIGALMGKTQRNIGDLFQSAKEKYDLEREEQERTPERPDYT